MIIGFEQLDIYRTFTPTPRKPRREGRGGVEESRFAKREGRDITPGRVWGFMEKEKQAKERMSIYTDGGSRGNPGRAAIGVVLKDGSGHTIKTYGKAIGIRTNNEAEYEAVVFALAKVKALFGTLRAKALSLDCYMDSELVMRQLDGKYKIEEERLFPLFIKIWNARIDFASIAFHHIPREKNKEADQMVNEVLDSEQKNLF